MEAHEVIPEARAAISARRVFGKPYAQNGVVVIPVAKVGGGGGGGGGRENDRSSGSGFGFGMRGHPVGAYVIREDKVKWKPAIDLNGLLFRAQAIGAAAALLFFIRRRR
jgi:uncharacterized spore protein YtfJ